MPLSLNVRLIEAVETGPEVNIKRLIETGASPNARKEFTLRTVAATEGGGTQWKEETVEFESALALAILYGREGAVKLLLDDGANVRLSHRVETQRGGTVTCRGYTSDCSRRDGTLPVDFKGGVVTLNHPRLFESIHTNVKLEPNIEIIRLLLASGVRVTDVELDAARQHPEPEFLRVLVSHRRGPVLNNVTKTAENQEGAGAAA
ncbi:hypothetical protein M427DRAFT_32328 [Gonapodya prolifera JEL478]|uniref:Uncharacterized protein n=1 Tax=Gonapodya prolifera (strain JEL478) TaxID=1344416 RepID=A0A139AFZ9_GONPJ|nr:hypothetical protein M427DRAFT_32328 [Gonapodya prolifera JEL478]|eukprot:KXS15355.1 hypothetical protein M427DRAFT_32328 [Gonapodya prolifera JEL478]